MLYQFSLQWLIQNSFSFVEKLGDDVLSNKNDLEPKKEENSDEIQRANDIQVDIHKEGTVNLMSNDAEVKAYSSIFYII